jgi:redox-sensing transcriptional repressor
MAHPSVSMQTIGRLPLFLNYLRALPKSSPRHISAKTIADALGLNDVQVRKDLAAVSNSGRPKIGYITQNLIFDSTVPRL